MRGVPSLTLLVLLAACGSASSEPSSPLIPGISLRIRDSTGQRFRIEAQPSVLYWSGPSRILSGADSTWWTMLLVNIPGSPPGQNTGWRGTQLELDFGGNEFATLPTNLTLPIGMSNWKGAQASIYLPLDYWVAESGSVALSVLQDTLMRADVDLWLHKERSPSTPPYRIRGTLIAPPFN